jgi:hypothetical protein
MAQCVIKQGSVTRWPASAPYTNMLSYRVAGVEKPGATGGRCLGGGGGATVQLSKQGIPSFGQKLSGPEFSGIH